MRQVLASPRRNPYSPAIVKLFRRNQGSDRSASRSQDRRVSLERESNESLNRWARDVRRQRLSGDLLNLAWTAGPVTGLGLYGGYYLAYREPPHAELMIYFISFTIFSGLLGLAARILYNSTWGTERQKVESRITQCVDRLGDLILAVRDLSVDSLEGDARRNEAARQMLRRVRIPPSGLAMACEDLTGDAELGRCLAQIDAYRRAGLYSRIRDLHALYDARFGQALGALREHAPEAASTLQARYRGQAPRLEQGVPRDEYFVERVLAAAEQHDSLLVTTADAEAMLVLAFELINGREIPMLVVDYSGQWRLAHALSRLERARGRYRLALASGTNRLRALASFLVESDALAYESVPDQLPAQSLVERNIAAMDRLARRVEVLRRRQKQPDPPPDTELRETADTLATAMRLYRKAYEAIRHVGAPHADLIRASMDWNRVAENAGEHASELHLGPTRRGLQIVERNLSLDPGAREDFAQHLLRYLEEHHREGTGVRQKHGLAGQREALDLNEARRLAVEIAIALEPHIGLSRPEVQRALGASNASYVDDLEPGMSGQEKRTIGETMARELKRDLSRAAERLAVALVKHYRVELTETARDFLATTYGARDSVLSTIARTQSDQLPRVSLLSTRPPHVPPPRRGWYRSLVHARQLLQHRGQQ